MSVAVKEYPVTDSSSLEARQTGPWRLLLCLLSGIVAAYAWYEVMLSPQTHRGWSTQVAMICVIWLAGFFLFAALHFRSPYLFTNAYVLALSLFHLGITIPDGLGFLHNDHWQSGMMAKWLEHAGWYTALALGCLGVGFSLSLRSSTGPIRQSVPGADTHYRPKLFLDGIGLTGVSVAMLVLAIASFGNLLQYSRAEFFQGAGDTRGLGVFLIIFPSAVILLVVGATQLWQKVLAWTLFAVGFLLIMLSGYRTSALYPLMIGGIVWVKTGRRIPTMYAISGVVAIALAISAVGLLRQHKYGEMDINTIQKSAESATFEHTFTGMGQTGALLAHVLRLVPAEDPYTYGAGLFQYLKAALPNISLSMSESSRAVATRMAVNDPYVFRNLTPADWLSYHLIPNGFLQGHGVGFTAIGEPYLNFGTGGVIVFFLLIGFLLGRLDQVHLPAHPHLIFFCSAILWHLVRTARDDFGNFIKPLVFTYVIVLLWRLTTKLFIGEQSTGPTQSQWLPVKPEQTQ